MSRCVRLVKAPLRRCETLPSLAPHSIFIVDSQDVVAFRGDFDTAGPASPTIPPHIAIERLALFKEQFENLERRMVTFGAGEELFGLRVTQYPELAQTKRDLLLCDTLFKLFDEVSRVQTGFRNMHWRYCLGGLLALSFPLPAPLSCPHCDRVSVQAYCALVGCSVAVDNLSAMSDRFAGFDGRCKRLPKKVRTWETYAELRRRITLFNEVSKSRHMIDIWCACLVS